MTTSHEKQDSFVILIDNGMYGDGKTGIRYSDTTVGSELYVAANHGDRNTILNLLHVIISSSLLKTRIQ